MERYPLAPTNRMRTFVLLLGLFLGPVACNKPAPNLNISNLNTDSLSSLTGLYPHSTEFRNTRLHGQRYLENASNCRVCHGADLKGGQTGVKCETCHTGFPHSDEFKRTALHGKTYTQAENSCKTCHGQDLLGGDTQVSCKTCHAEYPHSAEFKTTRLHGKTFLGKDPQCKSCHGDNLLGGSTGVSCKQCHAAYPHTDDFGSPEVHGKHFLFDRKQCDSCHRASNPSTNDGLVPSCKDCHSFPHESDWMDPAQHGNAYYEQGDCKSCHDPASDFVKRNPKLYVSCDTCHTNVPHVAGFMRNHQALAAKSGDECVSCHQNYQFRNPISDRPYPAKTSCLDCHGPRSKLVLVDGKWKWVVK